MMQLSLFSNNLFVNIWYIIVVSDYYVYYLPARVMTLRVGVFDVDQWVCLREHEAGVRLVDATIDVDRHGREVSVGSGVLQQVNNRIVNAY